mgnify:CR=1 FL=1
MPTVLSKNTSPKNNEAAAISDDTGKMPASIVEEKGLKQTSDSGELEALCEQAIENDPDATEKFRSGKEGAINALKGYVMKATRGQANPKVVDEILRKKLGS